MSTGKNTQQSWLLLVNCECYTTEQLIWTQLVCSNFIFRLNMKQLLPHQNPFLGHTWLPSAWELSNGFTESFFRGVVTPLIYSCLCGFLATLEALYPVEHNAACRCCFSNKTASNWWWICDSFSDFLPQELCGPSLPMTITFHELDVHGSMHHNINYLEITNKM
jgi:hypothetical protein